MFQLSFLNASLLFFAAATIVPLLIWLLAKKKPLKVLFPTLRFIKLSKEQEKSRSKLKNILLLIIRMLIILLVALAVARPMFSSAKVKPSAKHPPTALAILLDTSFSMDYAEGGKSNLQQAKDILKAINQRTNQDDRLILVTSDENWNLLHGQIYASRIPEPVIDKVQITYSPIPLEEMLEYAQTKLSESQMPNREAYIISDNRMEAVQLKADVPLAQIPLPENQSYENLSCTWAKALPQLVDKKNQQLIQFRIENHGQTERKDVLVKAVMNDIKLAERFVNVPARQVITETISVDLRTDGWQSGYIEVNDERQPQDNRCYFAFPFYSKPRIAVISHSRDLPFFLSSALGVYSGTAPTVISPEAMSIAALDSYQLFVLYDSGVLSSRLKEVLAAIQARKLGLLVCLGDNLPADMKAYLNNTFMVEIKERSQKALSIDYLNPHQYISSLVADKPLKNSVVADYWQATSRGATGIVSASQQPLVVLAGKQALWLWNMASLNNPFFVDPAFPVLAFRTFDYIANTEAPDNSGTIGQVLTFDALRLPNGETVSSRKHLADTPGIYVLEPGTPRTTAIAVNIDYTDSQARLNAPKGVKQLGKNWQGKLFFSRLGHDLWKTLLAIAFALVILELIIVKSEEARSRT